MNERRPSSNPPTIDLSDSLVLPVVSLAQCQTNLPGYAKPY